MQTKSVVGILIILSFLAWLIYLPYNHVIRSRSPEAIFNLSDSELKALEDRALIRDDANAAWRVHNYYVFTKHYGGGEALKWQSIAEKLDAKAKEKKASSTSNSASSN